MKVSLEWLVLGILLGLLAWLAWRAVAVYEAFTGSGPAGREGFANSVSDETDISLSACPPDTTSYLSDNGLHLCCRGSIVDGKCSGQNVCSLSEATDGVPTCGVYYASVLEENAGKFCPQTMPYYFVDNSTIPPTRGCTNGRRKKDGSGPAEPGQPQCKIYSQEKDELSALDSCTNAILLSKTKCFTTTVDNVQPTLVKNGDSPALILCQYRDITTSMPRSCFSDESINRASEADVVSGKKPKGWKDSLLPEDKLQWCSKHQKVYLDRTKSVADLKTETV